MVRAGSTISDLLSGSAPARAGRSIRVGRGAAGETQRPRASERVEHDLLGREPLGETDPLLQRLRHLLVIEGVARCVDQATPVDDGGTAPLPQQLRQLRLATLLRGRRPLGTKRARVIDELRRHLGFLRSPIRAHRRLAALAGEVLVAGEKLLHLQGVVGERLGGSVDRGQPTADHHHRQPNLQIGEAVGLGGAGQLKRHQEVGGLAHTGREAVAHRDDGRPAGPRTERNVIEAEAECIVDAERSAEAHAAEHPELGPPLEQEPDQLEEVLVPAHRDAVFGDAAEARHDAGIERLAELGDIADRTKRHPRAGGVDAGNVRRQRLDLEPVHGHDGVTVVHEMMGEGEPGRPEPDHQHGAASRGFRQRPAQVERIPAGQQPVELEAPRQRQHLLEHAGFDLRNVDRLLLLVDAGLHAVVADAVAGGRAHRIVDDCDRQRAEAVAARQRQIHLGDLFVERTARQHDAERALLELAGLLAQPLGAGILALVVTPDAVVGVVERTDEIGSGIGQREAVTRATSSTRQRQPGDAVDHLGHDRNEMLRVDLVRNLEQHAVPVELAALRGVHGPGGIAGGEIERRGVLHLVLHPALDGLGKAQLGELAADQRLERGGERRAVERRSLLGTVLLRRAPLHEQPFHRVERVKRLMTGDERAQFGGDTEQLAEEVLELRRELDDQVGFRLARCRIRRGTRRQQPDVQIGIAHREEIDEPAIEARQTFAMVEILESQVEAEDESCSHRSTRPRCAFPPRRTANRLQPSLRRRGISARAGAPPDPRSGLSCTISRPLRLMPGTARSHQPGSACP